MAEELMRLVRTPDLHLLTGLELIIGSSIQGIGLGSFTMPGATL